MMKITLVCLGKLKENYWKEAEAEYLKRLTPYAKIKLLEITEEPFRESDDRDKIKEKEAQKIKQHLSAGAVVLALHERGKEFTSVEFSKFLEQNSTRGEEIIFVIGGPLGLHESILQLSHSQVSLSQCTFPHQMVRTILLEQIYRASTILNDKQYHY